MGKRWFTTGEVAVIYSVTPDAVLKWIKTGKLPAVKTPGGHYRISCDEILDKIRRFQTGTQEEKFQYCWEFHSGSDGISEECEHCIVKQAVTKKCFVLNKIPVDSIQKRQLCPDSCEDCEYYKKYKDEPFESGSI